MAIHYATFRIHFVSEADYAKRYLAITAKIKSFATGAAWEATTSDYLFESRSSAAAIASAVYLLAEFRSTEDQILVVNTSDRNDHAVHGSVKDAATLAALLKKR